MIKKGIILAGGKGSRISPLTKSINKQLLPIYDKPMIFYPLSLLMLANIKKILIIVNKGELEIYRKLIPDGKNLGIEISYLEQDKPNGLPEDFTIGEKFIQRDKVAMILGDNFFYGQSLGKILKNFSNLKNGAKVLLYKVKNPQNFGVAKINKNKQISLIKEKPKKFISDYAITGIYFFDNKVIEYTKKLVPSKRGELEITDLLKKYLKKQLRAEILGRGGAWLDTGSIENLHQTSNFVYNIQHQQGFKIACLEEIAFSANWIGRKEIKIL